MNTYYLRTTDYPTLLALGAALGVNRLTIGANSTGTVVLNGTIKKIAYYPARLPDSVIQTVTQ